MYLDKSLNDIQKRTKPGVFVVALEGLNIIVLIMIILIMIMLID